MATHVPVMVDELFGELKLSDSQDWQVIHTKPRQEKKLATYCSREGIFYYLPQMEREHMYKHRKVKFMMPMFPGYIFLRLDEKGREKIKISGAVVSFIRVRHQKELLSELHSIYLASHKQLELGEAIWLDKGLQVEVIAGPLKGMRGVVENHQKIEEVQLQIEILHQAVMVKVKAQNLKIIGEYTIVEQDT